MQDNPRRKRRVPQELRSRATEMLMNEESVHQVWRVTNLSKPYIQDLRDELKAEGRISSGHTLRSQKADHS